MRGTVNAMCSKFFQREFSCNTSHRKTYWAIFKVQTDFWKFMLPLLLRNTFVHRKQNQRNGTVVSAVPFLWWINFFRLRCNLQFFHFTFSQHIQHDLSTDLKATDEGFTVGDDHEILLRISVVIRAEIECESWWRDKTSRTQFCPGCFSWSKRGEYFRATKNFGQWFLINSSPSRCRWFQLLWPAWGWRYGCRCTGI